MASSNENDKLLFHSKECVSVIKHMLKESGLEHNSSTVTKLMDFTQKYLLDILKNAQFFMENDNRSVMNISDIQIAIKLFDNEHERTHLNMEELKNLTGKINIKALPMFKKNYGAPLPAQADYCLTRTNYKVKYLQEAKYINLLDKRHPLFTQLNVHFSNFKNRMNFSQAPYNNISHPLFHFTSFQQHNLMQKQQKLSQSPQKLSLKPKFSGHNSNSSSSSKSGIENVNPINAETKKEVIKRPVCPEPQKIIFKPKLLLSLNTNDFISPRKKNEESPSKRKKC